MAAPFIYHVRIKPDQHGNPVTQAEKDAVQKRFDDAAKASVQGVIPPVVVTSDRVTVEIILTAR